MNLTSPLSWLKKEEKSSSCPELATVSLSSLVCKAFLARAPFIGFGKGIGQTQSEESVRGFKGSRLFWSLCYLKALKLYNAKQSRFSLFMDHISPLLLLPYIFSSLTADNTENSPRAKKIPFTTLSKIIILELKEKIHIHVYAKIYIFIFSSWACTPHWIWIGCLKSRFDQSRGGFFEKYHPQISSLTC